LFGVLRAMSAAIQSRPATALPLARLCQKCRKNRVHGKSDKARFCLDCIGHSHALGTQKQHKPRTWISTEAIDQMIRDHYLKRVTNGGRPRSLPTLEQLGKKVGWSKFAIQQRARKLGVTRAKEAPWSAAELSLLEQLSYLTPERIRLLFSRAGYKRSAAGINIQLKRRRLRSAHGFYTARGLADVIGVDSHLVVIWIKRGDLKATRRGTDRKQDEWLLRDEWVRDFVIAHPMAFDIRRVDQGWFINMLTKTKPSFPPLSCGLCKYQIVDGRQFLVARPECSTHGISFEHPRYTARRPEEVF